MEHRIQLQEFALFLDIDGTLVDFADTPEKVVVPPDLIPLLRQLHEKSDGALALASGRSLQSIDRLVQPLRLPCGAEHGAELRLPDGQLEHSSCYPPEKWAREALDFCSGLPGTWVERKSHGIVLHYRNNPALKSELRALTETFVTESSGTFELLEASMAWEVRPVGVSKGNIVRRFMTQPPFLGRRPLFIGDDLTDEAGCAAARAGGGLGLTVAADFPSGPQAVRDWLWGQISRLEPPDE